MVPRSEAVSSLIPERSGAIWGRIRTVAWCSILLGLAIEIVLVAIAAGCGTLKGFAPVLADAVQKTSWSFLVCMGIACGTVATRASPAASGALGLLCGPIAFSASRALHKATSQALAIPTPAGSGPSLYWIAGMKGVEYGLLGAAVAWIASRKLGLLAHLAAGAAAGLVFGGWIVLRMVRETTPPLAAPAIAVRSANELLFPVGCAFVIYVAGALQQRLR